MTRRPNPQNVKLTPTFIGDPNDTPRVAKARIRDFLNREGPRAIRLMRLRLGFTTAEMDRIMGYKKNYVDNMEGNWSPVSSVYYRVLVVLVDALERGALSEPEENQRPLSKVRLQRKGRLA